MPPDRSYLGGIASGEIQLVINTPFGRQAAHYDRSLSRAAVEGIAALRQQRQVEVIALQDIHEPWGGVHGGISAGVGSRHPYDSGKTWRHRCESHLDYTHWLQRGPSGIQSPADHLGGTEGSSADRVSIHEPGGDTREALP